MGHLKNYILCGKNYIRHNPDYIRPFFSSLRLAARQAVTGMPHGRRKSLPPKKACADFMECVRAPWVSRPPLFRPRAPSPFLPFPPLFLRYCGLRPCFLCFPRFSAKYFFCAVTGCAIACLWCFAEFVPKSFGKKVGEKFGCLEKPAYFCTRFRGCPGGGVQDENYINARRQEDKIQRPPFPPRRSWGASPRKSTPAPGPFGAPGRTSGNDKAPDQVQYRKKEKIRYTTESLILAQDERWLQA